jgi:hypothetical protein
MCACYERIEPVVSWFGVVRIGIEKSNTATRACKQA